MIIDTAYIYALALGTAFVVSVLFRLRWCFRESFNLIRRYLRQHLVYPYLVQRHRLLGPWSRAAVLYQMCFVFANAFCVGFRTTSIQNASRRAARLALLNLVPAYGSTHLSFLADTCGVSLHTIRMIHRSAGTMAVLLLSFHITIVLALGTSFSLHVAENMWGLIVSILRTIPRAFIRYQNTLTLCRVLPT